MKHVTLVACALLVLTACDKKDSAPSAAPSTGPRPEKMANGEPAVITVKHVLIAFKDSGKKATRS